MWRSIRVPAFQPPDRTPSAADRDAARMRCRRTVPRTCAATAFAFACGAATMAHAGPTRLATPAPAATPPSAASTARPGVPATAAHGGAHAAPRAAGKPTRPAPAAPPAYVQTMRALHGQAPAAPPRLTAAGLPMLVLYTINLGERTELAPLDAAGHFASLELDHAAEALRDPATGNRHPVEPLTLAALYQLQVHFHAPEVRVVSGYRTPRAGTHSNHGRGRAIDFILPGTKDEDVAKVARTRGFAGVGVYPVSGFLHVDVREHSYFWVDRSGPGRPHIERGVLQDLARESDESARARGERPPSSFQLATQIGQAAAEDMNPDADDEDTKGDAAGDGQ